MVELTARVIVVGSINLDLTVRAETIPQPGETVLGGDVVRAWGGKGANQAVAAAHAGAEVWMIGAVGDDSEGEAALADLSGHRVGTGFVRRSTRPTGTALIVVDAGGDNAIAVAPGANGDVTVPDLAELSAIAGGPRGVVLVSFEVRDEALVRAADLAQGLGWELIVNPAPARRIPQPVLDRRPIVIPNQTELATLTGLSGDVAAGADRLRAMTSAPVIVTQGAQGCLVVADATCESVASPPPTVVVDTIGAGDAFCGAFAVARARGASLIAAAEAGVAAGSQAVTHAGARQPLT